VYRVSGHHDHTRRWAKVRKVVVAICTLILSIGVMGFSRANAAPICAPGSALDPVETALLGPSMGAAEVVFSYVDLVDGTVLGVAGLNNTLC
jgi:hypothetical protein